MATGTYLTAQGMKIKSLGDIQDGITGDLRADIDPLLATGPDDPVGQLVGPFCSQLREAWEVLGILANGIDPDAAEGFLLENVSAITGTERGPATYSTFAGTRKLAMVLGPGASIAIGTMFEVPGTSPPVRFQTTEKIVAVAGGTYLVAARATVLGPVSCNANTLTGIVTPVVGLTSVNNPFDAILGAQVDTDPQLRVRRETELRSTGSASTDALRSNLLAYTLDDGSQPILQCTVFANDTDIIDANGLPPHSVECLVFDGVGATVPNNTIAQIIFDTKAGGVRAVGGVTTGIAIDSEGAQHIVPFSRPTIKDVAFQIVVQIDALTYAGDPAAKTAILAKFTGKSSLGATVRCNDYVAALLALTGVVDVPSVQITFQGSTFPSPGVNLVLAPRQVGVSQLSWIAVSDV